MSCMIQTALMFCGACMYNFLLILLLFIKLQEIKFDLKKLKNVFIQFRKSGQEDRKMSCDETSTDIREMLELQLAEVEMLESMFANPGEFTLDGQTVLEQLRAFLDGTISYECLDSRVGFTVRILTSTSPVSSKLHALYFL